MSRQSSPGTIVSGPPTTSSSHPVSQRLRPNPHGLSAFHRESQLSTHYPSIFAPSSPEKRRSEWDVVRDNHRFIRDGEEVGEVSWEERVARAYESKLFKEFALIDLKHYKSKKLALRWRTAPEVVEGIGQDTCAALRCRYHQPPEEPSPPRQPITFGIPSEASSRRGGWEGEEGEAEAGEIPELQSFELPFVYLEAGERKEALVKVRLCPKCAGKLLWKPPGRERGEERGKEKGKGRRKERERSERRDAEGRRSERGEERRRSRRSASEDDDAGRRRRKDERERERERERGLSRSPRRSSHHEHEARHRNIM